MSWPHHLYCSVVISFLMLNQSEAHTTGISYSDIQVNKETIQVVLSLNLKDFVFVEEFDVNEDQLISQEEVSEIFPRFIPLVIKNYQIDISREIGRPQLVSWRQRSGLGELECHIKYIFSREISRVRFTVTLHNLTDSGHWNLAQVRYPGGREELFFNLESPTAALDVNQGWESNLQLDVHSVVLGVRTVLSSPLVIGFLLGLFLTISSSPILVRTIAAFVAAQGLMLTLVTLEFIKLPITFLDPACALSLAYIAAENLFVKETVNRWIIAGCFGLLFGADLSPIQVWTGQTFSLASLWSWILGSSMAIMLVSTLIFLVTRLFQRSPQYPIIIHLSSGGLLVIGLLSFFYQAFG